MRCLQIPRFSRGALVALLPCALAHADVVADWNAIALKTLASPEQDAAQVAHAMATVHVAMFEVMNFIEGAYVPRFLVRPPAPVSGSGEAAAAAAAHYVLRELRPDRSAELDAALERSLAFITDAQQKASARVWGRHLGANICAIRSADIGGLGARVPRAEARNADSVANITALNGGVARLVEAKRLKPIDAARVHALTAMALSDAYAAAPAADSLAASK
jgi:hypothetical protein